MQRSPMSTEEVFRDAAVGTNQDIVTEVDVIAVVAVEWRFDSAILVRTSRSFLFDSFDLVCCWEIDGLAFLISPIAAISPSIFAYRFLPLLRYHGKQ